MAASPQSASKRSGSVPVASKRVRRCGVGSSVVMVKVRPSMMRVMLSPLRGVGSLGAHVPELVGSDDIALLGGVIGHGEVVLGQHGGRSGVRIERAVGAVAHGDNRAATVVAGVDEVRHVSPMFGRLRRWLAASAIGRLWGVACVRRTISAGLERFAL